VFSPCLLLRLPPVLLRIESSENLSAVFSSCGESTQFPIILITMSVQRVGSRFLPLSFSAVEISFLPYLGDLFIHRPSLLDEMCTVPSTSPPYGTSKVLRVLD